MFHKYIGDRAFYRRILYVVLPIIIQNGISNFVSLLDNIMVGRIGTLPMSGVSIVNQLMFVFNLCIFGASSGAGIFTAQFHGSRDDAGIRYTFRFKVLICSALSILGITLFLTAGDSLIGLYLTGEGSPEEAAQTLAYGREYILIMLFGLLPFALSNAYSSTLRETQETFVPMIAGIAAVCINLGLNYVLIFGHLGLPALGVRGAALATVLSRFAELGIVAGWTHTHPTKKPFIRGAYRSAYIPGRLLKTISMKGLPLLVNEFLWSCGVAFLNQCYSTCSLDVVPAMNIATTLTNLGSVVFLSMGNAVGILMGQMLGARESKEAVRDANRKMIFTSVVAGSAFGALMACFAGVFPQIYNTTPAVRALSVKMILVSSFMIIFHSYANAAYFTLRSGGKTFITFLFDSGFLWVCSVPLAFCLSRYAKLPILPLYMICQIPDMLKCLIGAYMLKKGSWIQNLT